MSDSRPIPLSRGEMEIMEVVWDRGEVAAQEVRDILCRTREVSRNTVRTMLARMEEKGWLKHRLVSQTFFYSPLIAREVSLGDRVLKLVDRACGGRPERLVNALVEYRGLTPDEVARIRQILDAAKPVKPKKGGKGR